MANIKTITLGGAEQKVIISGQNCDIRNDSSDTVYASVAAGITADADGVVSIPVGQAVKLLDTRGTVYLLGTGKVQLCGNDYSEAVFKCAPSAGGGSGEVTKTYVDNGDDTSLKLAKQYAEENFSNPNLFDNPTLVINQRGKNEYSGYGYTVDRWIITNSNPSIIVGDGYITIDNTNADESVSSGRAYFRQHVDQILKGVYTISAYVRGTGKVLLDFTSADYSTAIKSIETDATDEWTRIVYTCDTTAVDAEITVAYIRVSSGAKIDVKDFKLELGSAATPFIPPDPATELAKCQRYYIGGALDGFGVSLTANTYYVTFPLPVTMRVNPSLENATFTVRDKLTNQIVTDLNDAMPYVANVSILRANSVTVGFNKIAHGITDVSYNAQLFGGLSADL